MNSRLPPIEIFRILAALLLSPCSRAVATRPRNGLDFGYRISALADAALLCLISQVALAATSSLTLTRTFDKTVALTNTSPDALRGFCYFDEVPSGLTVTTVSVTLNGQFLTNFGFESGLAEPNFSRRHAG